MLIDKTLNGRLLMILPAASWYARVFPGPANGNQHIVLAAAGMPDACESPCSWVHDISADYFHPADNRIPILPHCGVVIVKPESIRGEYIALGRQLQYETKSSVVCCMLQAFVRRR